jgi:hypothetical protein
LKVNKNYWYMHISCPRPLLAAGLSKFNFLLITSSFKQGDPLDKKAIFFFHVIKYLKCKLKT